MTDLPARDEKQSPLGAIWRSLRDWAMEPSDSGVSCCSEAEIERIAHDLAMTPAELRALAKHGPEAPKLLLERMAALDLDPAEVTQVRPETFRDMQRVCTMCENKRRCARDLAHHAGTPQWQDYCPNAQTLLALNVLPWSSRREW